MFLLRNFERFEEFSALKPQNLKTCAETCLGFWRRPAELRLKGKKLERLRFLNKQAVEC
jgi:hypothetical protein